MQWIARRLAAWLAPYLEAELHSALSQTIRSTQIVQIQDLKECTLDAVDKAIVARQMIEEFANRLGYELIHEGDSVIVTTLKKD